ncbi:MAG: iron ABC transporter permease, partial [Spirochaetales bacterium]|nr:iron ABC transporter permease [Spirochaetales bacterium]
MANRLGAGDAVDMNLVKRYLKESWILLVTGAVFAVFFILPFGNFIIKSSLSIISAPETANLLPGLMNVLKFSFAQAGLSALLSVFFALPGAYAISHYRFPLRRFFQSVSLLPFVLPSIVVIICMISFYGRSGFISNLFGAKLNLIYSFTGIIIAHVFFNITIALRIISDAYGRIGKRYTEAARGLGDGKAASFFRITLPLLMPSILTAFVLIFIYCFMSFGIVLVFGGIKYATLEVKVYQEMFQRLNFSRGALYAIVQLIISMSFLAFSGFLGRKNSSSERRSEIVRPIPLRFAKPITRFLVILYFLCLGFFLLGPIITMISRSVIINGHLDFLSYRSLFNPVLSTRNIEGLIRSTIPALIARSLALAFFSGTLTFTVAFAAALALRNKPGGWWRLLFQLPMGLSMIGLAMGLRILFGEKIPPFVLVAIGQFFLALPMVFRIVDTVVCDLQTALVDCARSLGATRGYLLRTIHLPVLGRGLLNGYAFSLAVVFADFAIVLGVGGGDIVTFPVAIYRLIGFRSFDLALSLSVIYILFCLMLFLLIDMSTLRGG